MNSKYGIIGIVALIVVVIGAFLIIEEANEGPLEKAAEDVEDAAEDIADEFD